MGTLFNQIFIERTDAAGDLTSMIRIPISYGPKDKVLNRRTTDEDLSRPFASILPFMTFEMNRMYYDPDRQLPKSGRFISPVEGNKNLASSIYNPVPYNFEFQLNIIVKNVEDGLKIVEQIAPFFDPDWTVTVKMLDEPEVVLDILTLMDPIVLSDNWAEGDYSAPRYVTWTLNFMMKGYLFGPSKKSKIIKQVETNYASQGDAPYATVVITPGLTANGTPTSDPASTVPYSQIDWTDDYGYITTIENYSK